LSRPKTSPFAVDAIEEYLRTKQAREPKTHAAYRGLLLGSERGTKKPLGLPFAPYFHNRRFHTVTHDEVAQWFSQRVDGAAPDTKHRMSKGSRAFLRFAHQRGYTHLDLASVIDLYPAGEPRRDWLEWPDVHRLIATISEFRLGLAVAWLFYSGCRVGEAIAANQRDVRFMTEIGLYGWTVPKTKTHAARHVWLPERLSPLIEESRDLNNPRPEWPILWDCDGRGFGRVESPTARISPRTINGALDRARDHAGLQVNVTAHVARHTYATNWIKEQGCDEHSMEKLSRQLGTSVAKLRATYVHIQYDDADWATIRNFGGTSKSA
jgi:integrase